MALSKDQIVAAIAARAKEVFTIAVPEWGGDVQVRRLTAADMERSGLSDGIRDATRFAKVIAISLIDDEGSPLFTEKDAKTFAQADMAAAARVFGEIMRVNGLMDSDLEEAVQAFANAQPEPSSTS